MVYVAIIPPETIEANLIKKVAVVVGKDFYGTRLLLGGNTPRIVAHYDTVQMAQSTAQGLRALGLVAIVCEDSELRKQSPIYKAQTVRFEERAVVFWDKGSQTRRMESRDAFLIIEGSIQTCTETEVIRTRMKFSLPATVLTGGIPIWSRVKEKTKDRSVQDERFVRLYDRASPESSVEIFQHDFQYSFLGARMSPSSLANFNTVVTKIRDTLPQAIFDDRLMKPFGVVIPFTAPRDNVEINCKLIYLYHRAVSNVDSSA
jgi:hypothetical protein